MSIRTYDFNYLLKETDRRIDELLPPKDADLVPLTEMVMKGSAGGVKREELSLYPKEWAEKYLSSGRFEKQPETYTGQRTGLSFDLNNFDFEWVYNEEEKMWKPFLEYKNGKVPGHMTSIGYSPTNITADVDFWVSYFFYKPLPIRLIGAFQKSFEQKEVFVSQAYLKGRH